MAHGNLGKKKARRYAKKKARRYAKKCVVCDSDFMAAQGRAMYCSKRCENWKMSTARPAGAQTVRRSLARVAPT